MVAIDSLKQNNNAYIAQTSESEQADSTKSGSIYNQVVTEQQSGESYTANDVKKQELEKIEALYKKLSDTFKEWGITSEKAKNAGVIEKVAGKNIANINDADVARIEKSMEKAVELVKAQKSELNLENLIKAANKINVATIENQNSWETVDAEIDNMQKGKRSSLFQHEDSTKYMERNYLKDIKKRDENGRIIKDKDGNPIIETLYFDTMTKEQVKVQAKRLGIKLSDSDNLETLKKELKAGMMVKFFSKFEFSSENAQLDDFTKMLINTTDPEEKKLFVEGIKALYAKNKECAVMKYLASHTDGEKRMDAAKLVAENLEEITERTTTEQAANIANINNTELRKADARETTERLNNSFEMISEIINKIENDKELNDEEKKFLEVRGFDANNKEALSEFCNRMKALNEGNDRAIASNNNYGDDARTEFLSKSMNTYTRIDEKTGSNIRQEMLESLTKYIEEHPEVKITKENLAVIIEKAELNTAGGNVSGSATGQGAESGSFETAQPATAQAEEIPVPFEQKVDKKEIEETQKEIEEKRSNLRTDELTLPTLVSNRQSLEEMGTRNFVSETLSSSKSSSSKIQLAIICFKNLLSPENQAKVINNAKSYFCALCNVADIKALELIQKEGAPNYDKQKYVDNLIEKKEEEETSVA